MCLEQGLLSQKKPGDVYQRRGEFGQWRRRVPACSAPSGWRLMVMMERDPPREARSPSQLAALGICVVQRSRGTSFGALRSSPSSGADGKESGSNQAPTSALGVTEWGFSLDGPGLELGNPPITEEEAAFLNRGQNRTQDSSSGCTSARYRGIVGGSGLVGKMELATEDVSRNSKLRQKADCWS
ncbi:unnamed protein product [Caretta caretta]